MIWEPDLSLDFRDLDLWMTLPRVVDWLCSMARTCLKQILPPDFIALNNADGGSVLDATQKVQATSPDTTEIDTTMVIPIRSFHPI